MSKSWLNWINKWHELKLKYKDNPKKLISEYNKYVNSKDKEFKKNWDSALNSIGHIEQPETQNI
jgi:hypothetical protein